MNVADLAPLTTSETVDGIEISFDHPRHLSSYRAHANPYVTNVTILQRTGGELAAGEFDINPVLALYPNAQSVAIAADFFLEPLRHAHVTHLRMMGRAALATLDLPALTTLELGSADHVKVTAAEAEASLAWLFEATDRCPLLHTLDLRTFRFADEPRQSLPQRWLTGPRVGALRNLGLCAAQLSRTVLTTTLATLKHLDAIALADASPALVKLRLPLNVFINSAAPFPKPMRKRPTRNPIISVFSTEMTDWEFWLAYEKAICSSNGFNEHQLEELITPFIKKAQWYRVVVLVKLTQQLAVTGEVYAATVVAVTDQVAKTVERRSKDQHALQVLQQLQGLSESLLANHRRATAPLIEETFEHSALASDGPSDAISQAADSLAATTPVLREQVAPDTALAEGTLDSDLDDAQTAQDPDATVPVHSLRDIAPHHSDAKLLT